MNVTDPLLWQKCLDNNQDPYGAGILSYAERWADLMEVRITAGEKLEDIAKETSHTADTGGITGLMYGTAVATLAGTWIFGDELRHWHNLDSQIGDEGERANESGGTLNPALLNIG